MQSEKSGPEIINFSKKKWLWMSECKTDSLATLFQEKAVFVHMGGNLSKDQELDVMVLNIDREKVKIALGLKQLLPNPWDEVESKYPIGSSIKGEIRTLTAQQRLSGYVVAGLPIFLAIPALLVLYFVTVRWKMRSLFVAFILFVFIHGLLRLFVFAVIVVGPT